MPAGRPTKYDAVVYGLHDGSGTIYYVGKTKRFMARMACYRAGKSHGNAALASKLQQHGLHWTILQLNPADLNSAEFDEIESRTGLVNVIRSRNQQIGDVGGTVPWRVAGTRCPSEHYRLKMRNSFGDTVKWVGETLSAMNALERVAAEHRFADVFENAGLGAVVAKWREGMPYARA